MKVFVTGAGGYIGKALIKAGFSPLRCDVVDYNDVDRAIEQSKPDLVLHLAGKSNPDWCETHNDLSFKINERGTYNVAEICAKNKIPAVLLSSSQIWGGGWWESLWNKHSETSKFTPAVNSYGMQKIAAEAVMSWMNVNGYQSAKIIRTSFVFNRQRFATELKWLEKGYSIDDAPTFLKRSFIHLDDFVSLIDIYCKSWSEMPKVLHLAGSKTVSYYDFWLEVCKQYGYDKRLVKPRRLERDFMFAAKRPHNAGLDVSLSQKLGFPQFDYIGGIKRMKEE